MFRSRGQNLRSVFILLFLNVAMFLLQHQDREKYARLFSFDWPAIRAGQVWRLVTYQFTQPGAGVMGMLSLFVTLLLLYMMGSALEEEWGTLHFLTLFAMSTLGSAAVAAWLAVPLLGTYFVFFTLLFVYASAFPQQTFFLFGMVPVRVRLLAAFSFAILLYGVFRGGASNLAALGGAVLAYLYYLTQRGPAPVAVPAAPTAPKIRIDTVAVHNGSRFFAIKKALLTGNDADADRLLEQCEKDIVPGVKICPPADYKPESMDGYCIRCEGFAECSARYLRAGRAPRSASPQLNQPVAE